MRKSILILLFMPIFCFGQSSITSLGPLKIGYTTISILDSLQNSGYDRIAKKRDLFSSYYTRPLFTISDSTIDERLTKNHLQVSISSIEVADIVINDISIDFYNDTLYSIFLNNLSYDLNDAIEIKYGKGKKVVIEDKEISCIYKITGASYKEKEFDLQYRYDSPRVDAYRRSWKYFNSDCEKRYIQQLYIYNKQSYTLINKLENLKRKIIYDKEKAEETKKLEGL